MTQSLRLRTWQSDMPSKKNMAPPATAGTAHQPSPNPNPRSTLLCVSSVPATRLSPMGNRHPPISHPCKQYSAFSHHEMAQLRPTTNSEATRYIETTSTPPRPHPLCAHRRRHNSLSTMYMKKPPALSRVLTVCYSQHTLPYHELWDNPHPPRGLALSPW